METNQRLFQLCLVLVIGLASADNTPLVLTKLILTADDISAKVSTSSKTSLPTALSREIFKIIFERLNITYEFRYPGSGSDGMVGQLYRNEADMSFDPMVLSYGRSLLSDSIFPILFDKYRLLVPNRVERNPGISLIFQPFSYEIWICLFVSCIVSAFILKMVAKDRRYGFPDYFLNIYGVFTGQEYRLRMAKFRVQIVLTGLCLAAVVLVNTYTTVVFSIITVPVYDRGIESLPELAKSSVLPIVVKGSSIHQIFAEAKKGLFKVMGDKLREHPDNTVSVVPSSLERVANGEGALLLTESLLQQVIRDDFDQLGECRFTLASEPVLTSFVVFAVQKHSPLRKIMDKEILLQHSTGIIDYFMSRLYRTTPCLANDAKLEKKLTPLKLGQFAGAFYMLLCGYALALTAFIYERIWFALTH